MLTQILSTTLFARRTSTERKVLWRSVKKNELPHAASSATCTRNGATGGGYATQRKEVGGSEMGQNIERQNLRQRGVRRGAESEPETGSRSTVGSGLASR
jgi:hypothetical protein